MEGSTWKNGKINPLLNEFENAYPWPAVIDKENEYSFLKTECGNMWYSVCKDPMYRNGCICPKCGRTIMVKMKTIDKMEGKRHENIESQ